MNQLKEKLKKHKFLINMAYLAVGIAAFIFYVINTYSI